MLSLTVLKGSVYFQLSFDSCYAIHVCHLHRSLQVSSVHVRFKKNAENNALFVVKRLISLSLPYLHILFLGGIISQAILKMIIMQHIIEET